VVGDEVDDQLDVVGVQFGNHLVEVGERAQARIDVAVVVDVVAAVGECGRVERAEPNRVDAERSEVADSGGDAGQVPDAVAVGIEEAARVDLVDHGLPPPVGVGRLHPTRPGPTRHDQPPGQLGTRLPLTGVRTASGEGRPGSSCPSTGTGGKRRRSQRSDATSAADRSLIRYERTHQRHEPRSRTYGGR
jgi:hypothetical protein